MVVSSDSISELELLARLPVLLNSTLDVHRVIEVALLHVREFLDAEATTVFLKEPDSSELTFWALHGADKHKLEGRRIPSGKGIVGWVIEHQQSVHVPDVTADPRFFSTVDKEGGFVTRDLLCVPLIVRGTQIIGALQALNSSSPEGFNAVQLSFLEHVGQQIALALDNSLLVKRLQHVSEKLRLLDKRKGEVASLLAHEFRTPLSIIQSAAELLTSGDIADKKLLSELSQTLRSGVERLSKVVSQVHNMSAISSQQVPVARTECHVSAVIESVVTPFRSASEVRELRCSVSIEPLDVKVDADERLLKLILSNLLSNAIRFTPNKGSIALTACRATGLVEFSVSDTGIGVAEDQQSAIFEKFYEVTDIMKHSSGDFGFRSCGLGLGLAAVRAMLKAHGSDVRVQSTLGSGSTFSFSLPAV